MGTATKLEIESAPTVNGRQTFDALHARLLVGAAERIHADVAELQRLGIIDAEGRRISNELPADMQPGAERDFGG